MKMVQSSSIPKVWKRILKILEARLVVIEKPIQPFTANPEASQGEKCTDKNAEEQKTQILSFISSIIDVETVNEVLSSAQQSLKNLEGEI